MYTPCQRGHYQPIRRMSALDALAVGQSPVEDRGTRNTHQHALQRLSGEPPTPRVCEDVGVRLQFGRVLAALDVALDALSRVTAGGDRANQGVGVGHRPPGGAGASMRPLRHPPCSSRMSAATAAAVAPWAASIVATRCRSWSERF